ncbi:MAG: response regulator, partial [Phaeodactylibacter sp.]|nr:response regulator [Phaeodactylibacter sp.]
MHATPDLKAIIIDDEESGRETLRNILTRFCKGVEVVGTANSVATGVEVIRAKEPDVVFLDVEMPKAKGYELIQYFEQPDFEVIFVTAYDEYAILA